MKRIILFCVLWGILCSSLYGTEREFPDSLVLPDGTVYEDVKLISQTPSEVIFKHSKGAKNVKISELNEDIQRMLNYSEEAARAVEAEQAKKTALRIQQLEDAAKAREQAKIFEEKKQQVYMIRGFVQRVLTDGILIEAGAPTNSVYYGINVSEDELLKRHYKSYPVARPRRVFGVVYLEGHPSFEHLTDGDVIDVDVYRDGIFRQDGETRKKYMFLKDFSN